MRGRGILRIDTPRVFARGGAFAALVIAAVFFAAGALAGALFGAGCGGEALMPGDGSVYGSESYAGLLIGCAKYHIAVALLSTSLLGVLLIPAVLAFRGFALACSALYLAGAYPESGTALALITLGLPGIFTVPALFVAAQGGWEFSARLLASFLRKPAAHARFSAENRALVVTLLLFAAAAVEYFVVPPLVRPLI